MNGITIVAVLLLSVFGWVGVSTDALAGAPPRIEEIVVIGKRLPPDPLPHLSQEEARARIAHARELLEQHTLPVYTVEDKKRGLQWLRGRPVTFATQSALDNSWHLITVELPLPARTWQQGKPYPHFKVVTPGYSAEHYRGIGENILMFRFYRDNEQLFVYGRKYPDLDRGLYNSRGPRAYSKTSYERLLAKTTLSYHLPYTPDLHYQVFVEEGHATLEKAASTALDDLRQRKVASFTYPEQTVGETIRAETLVVLALNEQMDHFMYRANRRRVMEEVLNQYGLHGSRAYSVSISTARALGPMQFTNNPVYKTVRRGGKSVRVKVSNGTYSAVLKQCAGAGLDPNFETGARDLVNSMKAAACLLDMELRGFKTDVKVAYQKKPLELATFSVAAYNGGPRNANRLYTWFSKRRIDVATIQATSITNNPLPPQCPCVWITGAHTRLPVEMKLSGLNEENRWYVEKYLFVLSALYAQETPS